MKIHIPQSTDAPETELFVKIVKREIDNQSTTWKRDVMILIPGGPGGNHTLYSDIEEDLLNYADLVIIDLRGCGYSNKCDVKFCTLTQHIRDLEVVRQALNINQPIVHGCSYGAMVALGYAINYPEKLSKLILSSGAASGKFIESAKNNLAKRGTYEQIEAAKNLWEGKFKNPEEFSTYYKTMASLYVFNYKPTDALPTLKYNIPYNIDLVNLAFTSFLKEFDYSGVLNKVRIPTLILSGKNDWITDPEQAELLHKGIKQSHLVILDKCGHFLWKDQKKLFLQNMQQFLINKYATPEQSKEENTDPDFYTAFRPPNM